MITHRNFLPVTTINLDWVHLFRCYNITISSFCCNRFRYGVFLMAFLCYVGSCWTGDFELILISLYYLYFRSKVFIDEILMAMSGRWQFILSSLKSVNNPVWIFFTTV